MDILHDIFHIGMSEKDASLWLQKDGEIVQGSPFYVKSGVLYDNYDQVRDDILGAAVRGEVTTMANTESVEHGAMYLFVDENKIIRRTKYEGNIIDMFNSIIGNIFKEDPTDADIERISSVMDGIRAMKINLFPNGIQNPISVACQILEITKKEKATKEEEYSGVLKKSFENIKK